MTRDLATGQIPMSMLIFNELSLYTGSPQNIAFNFETGAFNWAGQFESLRIPDFAHGSPIGYDCAFGLDDAYMYLASCCK
jgi:hypothetical protein